MQNIFDSGYTLYQVIWFFFIYAFLGWCGEVIFKSIRTGKFVNRGFLNGPICPIYGLGAVAVILILHPIQNNIFLLFVGSVIVTSLLELITGYILNVAFHTHWWDYSNKKFNIGGYICLQFSLLWGLACIALIKIIQPIISNFVNIIPSVLGLVLLMVFGALIIADATSTIIAVNKLNNELAKVTAIGKEIHKGSDKLAKGLGNKAIEVSEKVEQFNIEEKKNKVTEKVQENKNKLEKEIENLARQKAYIRRRIIKAFPDMKNKNNQTALEELKKKINKKTEK